MKTHLFLLFLLPLALMTGCSKDDDKKTDEDPQGAGTAYVKFTVSGPETNGDFEYRATDGNGFKKHGLIGYADESLTQPVAALFSVYKSLTESRFSLTFPSKTGNYTLPFHDSGTDEYYEIDLMFNREESYVGKAVDVKVSTLEYDKLHMKKCKGTFSGAFDLEDQTGQNLGTHQITGEFELN